MPGLLDFLESPTGQGLLGAAFGALGGRGTTLQAIGQGGLLGMNAYQGAKDRIAEQQQLQKRNQLFDIQLGEAQRAVDDRQRQQTYLSGINQITSPVVGAQPNKFDPIKWRSMGGDAATSQLFAKDTQPLRVSPGETLLNPSTLAPVYTAPQQAAPSNIGRLITERDKFPVGSPMRMVYDNAIRKETTHAPGTNVNVNTGQKGLDNELKLRSDFRGEPVYKAHQEMQSAYSQIQQSLKQGTPAGDLAGATKIMKLLDPGSVVRESELGMAMAATGLLDRAQNYANMVITGQKLTPQQRKEFQTLADTLYGESVKAYNTKRAEYTGFANDYGLNAGRVAGPEAGAQAPGGGMPSQDAIAAELARRAGAR